MALFRYPNRKTWWYEFRFAGQIVRESAKTRSKNQQPQLRCPRPSLRAAVPGRDARLPAGAPDPVLDLRWVAIVWALQRRGTSLFGKPP